MKTAIRTIAILTVLSMPAYAVKANVAMIASATTIAVNSKTILKWARHPKRESKNAGKALKEAAKGRN